MLFLQITIDEGKYVIDPAHHMAGPMKLELMTPHVETHGIYRFRQVPGKHQQLYLERHKKTVYSEQGKSVYLKVNQSKNLVQVLTLRFRKLDLES